jgi:hypothetical protein
MLLAAASFPHSEIQQGNQDESSRAVRRDGGTVRSCGPS